MLQYLSFFEKKKRFRWILDRCSMEWTIGPVTLPNIQWTHVQQQPKKKHPTKLWIPISKTTIPSTPIVIVIAEPATIERGRTLSRISLAKGANFRGRKSNSLMNLCGKVHLPPTHTKHTPKKGVTYSNTIKNSGCGLGWFWVFQGLRSKTQVYLHTSFGSHFAKHHT